MEALVIIIIRQYQYIMRLIVTQIDYFCQLCAWTNNNNKKKNKKPLKLYIQQLFTVASPLQPTSDLDCRHEVPHATTGLNQSASSHWEVTDLKP